MIVSKPIDPAFIERMRKDMEAQMRSELAVKMGGLALSSEQKQQVRKVLRLYVGEAGFESEFSCSRVEDRDVSASQAGGLFLTGGLPLSSKQKQQVSEGVGQGQVLKFAGCLGVRAGLEVQH